MFILFNCWFILVHPCAQDFKLHASLCSQLLEHYSSQYSDRRVYWAARERSANEGDMLTLICDSFDRSKLQLPMWPLNRTPKRTVYETLQRSLLALCFFSFFWNLLNTNSIPVILYQCVWPVTSEVQAWSWLAFFAMGMAFSSSWPPGKEWALAATGTGSAILDFKSNRKGLYKQCESSFLNNRLWVWSSLSIRLVTH